MNCKTGGNCDGCGYCQNKYLREDYSPVEYEKYLSRLYEEREDNNNNNTNEKESSNGNYGI